MASGQTDDAWTIKELIERAVDESGFASRELRFLHHARLLVFATKRDPRIARNPTPVAATSCAYPRRPPSCKNFWPEEFVAPLSRRPMQWAKLCVLQSRIASTSRG